VTATTCSGLTAQFWGPNTLVGASYRRGFSSRRAPQGLEAESISNQSFSRGGVHGEHEAKSDRVGCGGAVTTMSARAVQRPGTA
jgi:hypothetical protein